MGLELTILTTRRKHTISQAIREALVQISLVEQLLDCQTIEPDIVVGDFTGDCTPPIDNQ